MKKILALILALCMVLALCACGKTEPPAEPAPEPAPAETPEPPVEPEKPDIMAKSEGVMTYAEFAAAPMDSEVTIETFVQAKESWWADKATVYTQDADGAYFLYDMNCPQEDYEKLVVGQKIKVTGYKAEWSGEIEIVDATFEIEEGSWIAPATDVTDLFGTDALIEHMNEYVAVKGLVCEAEPDQAWDASSDLYLSFSLKGETYTFTLRRYLTGNDSVTYGQVKDIKPGDIVNVEAFLYWYNEPQARILISEITGNVNDKAEGVMTFAEYDAAALESEVTVEAYVQAKEGWWDNKATVYAQDREGGYFLYELPCSEEEYAKLVPGQKIKVTGYKAEWSGQVEIIDAKFELEDGCYVAPALDATALFGTKDLIGKMGMLIAVKGVEITKDVDSEWDASADLYIETKVNGKPVTFTLRRYLTGNDSETYAQVKDLKKGDVIDLEAFLYWYNAPQARIICAVKAEG